MDSDSWWPLVGVIVGAILGGGAQVVADVLRGRREHKGSLRASRQAAYAEVLACWEECVHLNLRYRTLSSKIGPGQDLPTEVWQPRMDAIRRLSQAVENVEILGPSDTADAANGMNRAFLESAIVRDDDDGGQTDTTDRRLFIDLAKRDLGIA